MDTQISYRFKAKVADQPLLGQVVPDVFDGCVPVPPQAVQDDD